MTETESMVERVAKAMISAIDEKEAFVRENDGICDVTVDGHVDFKALARAAVKEVESAVRAYMTWDEEGICEALAEQTAEGSEAKWPDAPFGGPRKKALEE